MEDLKSAVKGVPESLFVTHKFESEKLARAFENENSAETTPLAARNIIENTEKASKCQAPTIALNPYAKKEAVVTPIKTTKESLFSNLSSTDAAHAKMGCDIMRSNSSLHNEQFPIHIIQ